MKLEDLRSPIGLIAGNGRLPADFIRSATAHGLAVVVVALKGEADPELRSLAASMTWVSVGRLGKIIKVFKSAGVRHVALAGGVTRRLFVSGFRMDLTAIRMLSRLRRFSDDSLLRAIMAEIESSGVTVFAPHLLLAENVPGAGVFSSRPLTAAERADVEIGWNAAHTLGELDIGQSVVIRNKTVIAVEAVEGTDATLVRAGEVSGNGGVLIKVCKPSQDTRVDLPTIGVKTLEQCARSRITAIVGDAGKTIVLDPQAVREAASRLGIAIEFWESSQ
jgi:DUF1009 family protein